MPASPHTQKVAFNPIGQAVGMIKERKAVRDVIYDLVEGYVEASDRLQSLQPK